MAVKISSANVRGLNGGNKRRDVLEFLKKSQSNIYFIQDIHCGKKQEYLFKNNWDGEMLIASGTSNSRGVAILFRNNFEYKILEQRIDPNGNYLAAKIKMLDTEVTLVNIYGPNMDDPVFFNNISKLLDELQTVTIIMGGDWNLVQSQQLDTKHYIRENNVRARQKVANLKDQFDLTDPWRNNNPDKMQFTWFQRNPIKMSRIDYFLVSSDIMALTKKNEIKPGYRSDHSIISIHLLKSEEGRGKGFWKFNTSLLKDPAYPPLIKNTIKENIQRYAIADEDLCNPEVKFNIKDQLFFETLKMEIRKITIKYSSQKKRNTIRQENTIIKKIDILENEPNRDIDNLDKVNNLKEELETIRMDKIKGMILRSKVQWLEEGEKPTKFFATLEKRNYTNKLISKLNINGNIVENEKTILQETEQFYCNLYKSKTNPNAQQNNINKFLDNQYINALNEEEKNNCEGNITYDEIIEIIKIMKQNKSPGIDGIPVELYIYFWLDLGHFLVRSIQAAFIEGTLSITQKRGIITTIPKGDKPREYLKNWRPISLLTVDYKIITSVLAKRMKTVLNRIIGPDQRGFLKDRHMEENTRLVYDIIQYCKDNNKDGLLLLIDFEKAFDSLDWSYINKVLNMYNFGETFIKWFNIVYKEPQSCVINNGNYSKFFNLGRGCRQGDPWSPYIFILSIEPLAQCIKHNQGITGIKIGNTEIKIGQYADDTFLILNHSDLAIRLVMQTFKDFKQVSGLSINIDKTQAIKLGIPNNTRNCPILDIPYTTRFKLLGITFSLNLQEMDDINFSYKITQMKKLIKLYQWRNLSMEGRITIVKMHLLPKLIHVLNVLPTPKQLILKEINTLFSNFIWDNKKPKIQLNILVQDFKLGGQKMIHLSTFCKSSKLAWVKKLYISPETNSWRITACEMHKEKHVPLIFEGSINQIKSMANNMNNPFWKEVLQTWIYYRENNLQSLQDIIPFTVIWSSGLIKNPNLLLRKNEFMDKGLIYFKDIFNFETNQFMTRLQLRMKYNINITPFDLMCLLHSIPKETKNIIQNFNTPYEMPQYGSLVSEICRTKKTCKFIYVKLIKVLPYDIKGKNRWEQIFRINREEVNWQYIFKLPRKLTLDAQLRIFQYKILHRTLPSNSLLHKYQLRDNPLCDVCDNIIENIEHLFHLCPTINELWYDIADWLYPLIDIYQYINTENIILGIYLENNLYLENTILLILKRYIYINKCRNNPVTLNGAKRFLKHVALLETNMRNDKMKRLNIQKWLPLQPLLTADI